MSPKTLSNLSRKAGILNLANAVIATLFLFSAAARAEIIYRETFGRPPGSTGNINPTNFFWSHFNNAGAANTGGNGVNPADPGRPTDLANVNAGPNVDGTFDAYPFGWHYHDQNPRCLSITPEFSVNPANYAPGSIVFTWYQGNASAAHTVQIVVRVGSVWYASAQTFVNTVLTGSGGAFGGSAELMTFTYSPAAAQWLILNFDGDYDPTTGTRINSTVPLSIGAAPATDLSGAITAFGVYSDQNGGTGNRRFDSFTIQATPGAAGLGKTVTWEGSQGSDWNTSTANWRTNAGPATTFADGDFARFDDSGAAVPAINLVSLLFPGSVTVSNNTAAYVFGGSGALVGNGSLTKQGTGSLILAVQSSLAGPTTISGGTLQIGDGGGAGSLGTGNITNNGALVFNRTNSLTLTNAIAGTGSLTQNGSGTLTLGGAQTYTGQTVVNAGTLVVNGTLAGAVSNAAGSTLAGNGTVNGAVAVSGELAPGISAGTFGAGGLTLNSGATVTFEVGASNTVGGGVNDLIQVNGNLILNNNVVSISLLAQPQAGVPYRLVNYTGTATGNFATVVTIVGGSRYTATLSHDTTAKQINVSFVGSAANLKWNDGISGMWDAGTTTNWLRMPGNQPDAFLSFDSVLFDDTVGLQTAVDVSTGNVNPSAITNDSSVNAYTINGTSRITGTTRIVKRGTSTLTVNTSNDFSGGIEVQAGTVRLGNVNAGGSGRLTVNSGGTLVAGGAHTNAITLAGGRIGGITGIASLSGELTAAAGTSSVILLSDPENPTLNSEMNFTGNLRGSGNLLFAASDSNPNVDGGVGFRLRGTGPTDYSGTITVSNNVKGELQTGVTNVFSPAGTGKIVLVCGAYNNDGTVSGPPTGAFSEFNLRNNSPSNSIFGNDLALAGIGLATLNPLGSAPVNAMIGMGNLRIGDGQELGVILNAAPAHIVVFTSVTLTGGYATFSPKTPGFGATTVAGSDLSLGAITQQVAGSGIIMRGLRTLFLTGINTFTGSTLVSNGVLSLVGTASIATSTNLFVEAGTLLSVTGRVDRTLTLAAGQTLSGFGSVEGNVTVGPGATIAPGSSIGQLAISNNLVLQGITAIEIDKTLAQQDQIVGATNITYGGTLALTFLSGGGTLTTADNFKLFDASTYGGSFTSITPPTPGAGLAWDTATLATDGTLRIKVGSATPPQFGTVLLSGGNIVISITGGTPGGPYQIVSSTNLAEPAAAWPVLTSGNFDGAGNTTVTNPISGAVPLQFYRVKLP